MEEYTALEEQNIISSKKEKEKKPAIRMGEVYNAIYASLVADAPEGSKKARDELIKRYLKQQLGLHKIAEQYNVLILHDEGQMVKSDADKIYSAVTGFTEKKSILLILYSTGGAIGSAYLIGKLCREYSEERFIVVVPREAKSAATLLCCAADEIHMGSLSELGPIDPQIGKLPALGLKSSVENIADLVKNYPQASEMFAKYLHLSLELINLGYYERVAKSAAQYAERLLKTHSANLKQKPDKIAEALVYSYKDHGFVIDKSEASEIFGENVIKTNTDEYRLGNSIYENLMLISGLANFRDYYFYLIGSCDTAPVFNKRQRT